MAHTDSQTNTHDQSEAIIASASWGGDIQIDTEAITNNLKSIIDSIAPCKPRIIGVTKYFGLNAIVEGYDAGLRDFGESRAIDAIQKLNALPLKIKASSDFHFIGHLQTNKIKKIVSKFDYIHSIDSLKLAKAVSESALQIDRKIKVLLQVNNAEEAQKFGYSKKQLLKDLPSLMELQGIEIVGLMNMAPLGADEKTLRQLFGDLREFRDKLEVDFGEKLPELSMGMSDDYICAVKEGATMIRIGRKLFK